MSGVTWQVSCVTCFTLEKVTAKDTIVPESGVMCHLFGVRCNMKGVIRHVSGVLSPVTDPVPYVRCPVSCVTSQLSEKAQIEPTATANTLVMCLISLDVRCHTPGVQYQVLCVKCHVPGVTCQVSPIRCHVSPVTCQKM